MSENSTPSDGGQQPSREGAARYGSAPSASTKVLKALAHPVRQRIFRAIDTHGYARAADLAEILDLPANQISFHLRVLADADMIVEAPEKARDRRDRVWTTNPGEWTVGNPDDPVVDETLGGVVTGFVAAELHDVLHRLERWIPEFTSGRDSTIHGTLVNSSTWLTREDFVEMLEKIGEVMSEYKSRQGPDEEGAIHWTMGIIAADDEI